MTSTIENQDSVRIELRDKVAQLLSRFKGYYALLSDRNPETHRLFFLEQSGACSFNEEKVSEFHNDLEVLPSVITSVLSMNLPKTADNCLRELKTDWLYSKIGSDSNFYRIITFDHQAEASRIAENGEHNGQVLGGTDDIDRSLELADSIADAEFNNLVAKNEPEIEEIVKELGNIVAVFESLTF